MLNKTSSGYLRIAMLRNEKLRSLHISRLEEQRASWFGTNSELVRIDNSIIAGLGLLQVEGRASLYADILETQAHAEYDIFRINSMKTKTPKDMKLLTDVTMIKEAADYLELALQINYPLEFPNELVAEFTAQVNCEGGRRDDFGPVRSDEIVHPPISELIARRAAARETATDTPTQETDTLLETETPVSEETYTDEAKMTQGEPTNASTTSSEELEQNGDSSVAVMENFRPRVVDLYNKYKENEHAMAGQQTEETAQPEGPVQPTENGQPNNTSTPQTPPDDGPSF